MGQTLKPIAPGAAGKMVKRNWINDVRSLFKNRAPKIIVDGGAHTGGFTRLFLQHYPQAHIHAFEPLPGLATQLTKTFPKRVTVHPVALGAKNRKIKFNVLAYKGASSALEPSALLKSLQKKKIRVSKVLNVNCRRLDRVLNHADLIKLDLQGYELNALKGCGKLLQNAHVVVAEIEFIALYDGQPLFADIDLYLRKHKFRLFNLYDLWTHPQGQLTAGNAIFINERFYG
jgi:FkbM family methyltransferase